MSDLRSVMVRGHERRLGAKDPMRKDTDHWKARGVYGDFPGQKLYSRSEWKPVTMRRWWAEMLDQDGVGACNAFCTVGIIHGNRKRNGLPHRNISAGYLYGSINDQQDEGSNISDALKWMSDNGAPWESTIGMLEWRKNRWPRGFEAECKENIILEAYWCPTFDHAASAILDGHMVNLGTWWGQNDQPDSNYIMPSSPRGRRGGHSYAGIGLFPWTSGKWMLDCANSWGVDFGDNGFMKMPEVRFTSDGMSSGMWAVVAVTMPTLPSDLPPLVATASDAKQGESVVQA